MSEMKDRLKELRSARNLKQREVAEKINVSVGLVGRWEAGLQPVPEHNVYRICKEFGVRREWLETGVGEMFEEKGKVDLKDVDDKTIYYEAMERMFKSLPDEAKQAFKEFCDDLKSI